MKDLEPLSFDLDRLLDAERDIEDVAAPTRARVRERLASALPLLPLSPSIPRESPPTNPPSAIPPALAPNMAPNMPSGALALLQSKLGIGLLSLLVGASAGVAAHATFEDRSIGSPSTPSIVPVKLVVTLASPGRDAISDAPPAGQAAPPSASAASAPASSTSASPASASSASASASSASPMASADRGHGETQIKAERLLLETARTALTRGDSESALAALRRHAQQYPHGDLAEEREVMMVQALNASGDGAAAKQHAADFKKKFPDSLMRDAVDQSVPAKNP
jgi:TolA-binding protein